MRWTAHGRQVLALLALASTGVWATTATAKDVTVDIRSVTDAGIGDKLGTIVIGDKDKGLSSTSRGFQPASTGFTCTRRATAVLELKMESRRPVSPRAPTSILPTRKRTPDQCARDTRAICRF